MEIAESALAMTAKNKIHTKIAGLAKPQNTKNTHTQNHKKISPPSTRYYTVAHATADVTSPQAHSNDDARYA